MATWHQQRRPVRLWHDTQWTVVIDPPHSCRAVARFGSKAEAEQYKATQQHAYLLPPASTGC